MKALFFMLMIASSSAFAGSQGQHNYDCIISSLNAYESDIFHNLTPSEVDKILRTNISDGRRWKVAEVAKQCDAEERPHYTKFDYSCIADRLEAYNSSVYFNLSKSDIEELLKGNSGLSWKVIEVAQDCPAL